MGQIVPGVVASVVLSALFGLWRRHHKDKARPRERLLVGLIAAAGGVWLMCLIVLVMPPVPALEWMDVVRIFIKLAIFMVGSILALAGVSVTMAALGRCVHRGNDPAASAPAPHRSRGDLHRGFAQGRRL